ncbi:MAG: hypothetical protein IJR52_03400 [Selenomonadaceae bacterium]|nr:hypothetical protein [Selenomonadaceae bacterium]
MTGDKIYRRADDCRRPDRKFIHGFKFLVRESELVFVAHKMNFIKRD